MNVSAKLLFSLVVLVLLFTSLAYGSEKLLWKVKSGNMITTSPVVYNGFLYLKNDSEYMWILDAKTGTLKKMFKTGYTPDSSPLIEKDTLYLAIKNGNISNLSAYNLKTGELLWKYEMGIYDDIYAPAIRDNMIYIPCSKDEGRSTLFALSKNTGRLVWKADIEAFIGAPSSVSVSDDAVYIGTDDGNLLALSKDTGKIRWNFFTKGARLKAPFGPKGVGACAGIEKDTIYIGGIDSYLYAIDKDTGREKWEFKTWGEIISSPAIEKGNVYIASKDGYVYALSSEDGKLKWEYETGYSIFASPILSGNDLYIGDTGGVLHRIDKNTGKVKWRAKTGKESAISTSLIIVDGIFYAGDFGGNFFAISLENPNTPDWPMFMYDISHTGCICR